MSDRDNFNNARRKGRRAYLDGVPLSENPMRSLTGRMAWEDAWKAEAKEMKARNSIYAQPAHAADSR